MRRVAVCDVKGCGTDDGVQREVIRIAGRQVTVLLCQRHINEATLAEIREIIDRNEKARSAATAEVDPRPKMEGQQRGA
jgi:hypothetical protein